MRPEAGLKKNMLSPPESGHIQGWGLASHPEVSAWWSEYTIIQYQCPGTLEERLAANIFPSHVG